MECYLLESEDMQLTVKGRVEYLPVWGAVGILAAAEKRSTCRYCSAGKTAGNIGYK
jgi:hypothetical protein